MKSLNKDIQVWQVYIDKLKAYHKKYGDFYIPLNWKKDKKLSQWVENIRKHPNRLPDKIYKQLQKIRFDFNAVPDQWNNMFHKLEEFHQKHGHTYVPANNKEVEALFDWTVSQRQAKFRLTSNQTGKLNKIGFDWEILSHHAQQWEFMYQQLAGFQKKYGHTRVPESFKENKTLASWVVKQRANKASKKISKERIQKLSQIGFLWKEDIARIRDQAWQNRYNELVQYKQKHGHIDRLLVLKDNYQLGLWIQTQWTRQDLLSPVRRRKLNAIGFKWEREDIYEERWSKMYQQLKNFKAQHGHCRVTQSQDFKLSVWLQRNKRDKEKLPDEKRTKLEKLGVLWPNELYKQSWESMYSTLKTFRKRYGHLQVTRSNPQLFEWMQSQKRYKKENRLSAEREEKLTRLDFPWAGDIEKQKLIVWNTMYNRFKALKEKYGSTYSIKLKEQPDLDYWVNRQLHNKSKLSALKRKKLNAIDFVWNRDGVYWYEVWGATYKKLVAFKNKYGHCDVPQKYAADQQLAAWVNAQRTKKLSRDKKDKLNHIGFSWAGDVKEKRWLQRVKEFTDLKKKNKHLKIPSQTPLHSWIYQQQKNFHKLPKEKKKILMEEGIIIRGLR